MTLRLRKSKDNMIYLGLWTILFLAPVLSLYIRVPSESLSEFNWLEIFGVWQVYAIYLIIFILHNFLLAPLLIDKKKKWPYIISTLVLLSTFFAYQYYARPGRAEMRRKVKERRMEEKRREHQDMPFPGDFKDEKRPLPPMHGPEPFRHRHEGLPPFVMVGGREIVDTVIALLMLGMNLGVKLFFRQEEREQELQKLEQENMHSQLEYLKYQINPHFFMNTLNNIHALVDIDPELAKGTIVQLSKMMRYVLYEGNKPLVLLSQEDQFIRNYIELMKLRYDEKKVSVTLESPEQLPDMQIPPLLLINFIENAFKHGISYQEQSYIHINISFADNRMNFECCNSKHKESTEEHGGVGMVNTRKRLDLIYKDDYTLDIKDEEKTYEAILNIPLTQK